MKSLHTVFLCLVAACVAVAMTGCESSASNTVGIYKSGGTTASTTGHDAGFWDHRGMTPPSTQLQ